MTTTKKIRNLFEIDNAKNLGRDELVATFVTTNNFKRLLEPKNHVILGSRGSGKTALARMLSHSHLSRLNSNTARRLIKNRELIGIYVPTNIEWVGALKNKSWGDGIEAEELFQWRLNLAACIAFLHTATSCLENYEKDLRDRILSERKLVKILKEEWFKNEARCETIEELINQLYDLEHSYETELTRKKIFGINELDNINGFVAFATHLFHPLKRAIRHFHKILEFPDNSNWFICIDEAEFLTKSQHRILNTYLRASQDRSNQSSPNLVFKLVTMPYCHYTLETNVNANLNLDHDFQYIYIDQDPIFTSRDSGLNFVNTLFNKRVQASNLQLSDIRLDNMFGTTDLLENKDLTWKEDTIEYGLLLRYGSEKTIERAIKLKIGSKNFRDQIGRKILPALLLKESLEKESGRKKSGVYSGKEMVVRCGDGNPRRTIGILNRFLLLFLNNDNYYRKKIPIIPKGKQQQVLEQYSKSIFMRIKSEPEIGPELYSFVENIGNYMSSCIHEKKLSTDQVSSIRIDDSISDQQWALISRAVTLGLLYPNKNKDNPDHIPDRQGTFHLAYALAPYFKILPRREASRSINTIEKVNLPIDNLQYDLLH